LAVCAQAIDRFVGKKFQCRIRPKQSVLPGELFIGAADVAEALEREPAKFAARPGKPHWSRR